MGISDLCFEMTRNTIFVKSVRRWLQNNLGGCDIVWLESSAENPNFSTYQNISVCLQTFSEDLLLILEPYPTKLIILDSEHPPRFNFSYPIDVGDEVCSKPEILLLAVVITAPQNFLKRRLIRETWGGVMHKSKSMNVVFLVGHSSNQTVNNLVIEESNWNQDIIQGGN